ncbi:MAG TPA: DNA-directed RNA polymerase subunit beta [Candidatus Paceibacterota bacterium]|nr:DNA-directed RNA polymerase subunit beta [Candidatus Paceibacterota bacterium]
MQKKYFSKYKKPLIEVPNLVEAQLESYKWLVKDGLKDLFAEFSPIEDYSGKKFKLTFESFELLEPKYDEHYAKMQKLTYEAPLRVRVKLVNKTLKEEREQEIFMADFPIMTDHGTFIINGVERVIVPQLARSYGIFFTAQMLKGGQYFGAKIIPQRGAWVEIETDTDGAIFVRIDRKRKFPLTTLLRVLSGGLSGDQILELFSGKPEAVEHLRATLAKDPVTTLEEAYVEIYRKLRDGDLATPENARDFVNNLFGAQTYDLSHVGRFRFNERFGKDMSDKAMEQRTISMEDMVEIITHIAELNNDPTATPDDIDHLGSRRVRYFGEMFLQKLRVGMSQIRRNIQDRMSTIDVNSLVAIQFMSPRPLQARLKEFFTTNQLSQFMNQENTLAEIEHLRTLSALGPGGLTRERAGAEVRDVHTSHYGRVCPIHTPEGPNIGLILHLSMYARLNEFGMIESPYVKVENGKITKEVVYLNAFEEEQYNIAHGATKYDAEGNLPQGMIEVRSKTKPRLVDRADVHFIDVAPNEAFSIATSMIPFLEHNDANRALMGSNMQKQATPCIIAEAPLVATGVEEVVARDTGRIITAKDPGTVEAVDAKHIIVRDEKGKQIFYKLVNFSRSNGFTAFHQRPIVNVGDKVKRGQVLADTSSTDGGQMALGQNALVAFMSWNGANYEDAIIISERVVKDSKFSSIHIEEFTVNVRDTKLGPEQITPDIPNVGENKLKDLDEDGIVRIGAEVRPGDILVGKITPKGEAQLTPEERLLRSLFGEKARDVKDTSLRVEHGKRGRVVGVKIFSRERGDALESGIIMKINIEVAQLRSVTVGDKLAGRHGNKGVIARILPEEDMPYMEDGTPVDVILTPLGVPSRMNLGQIFELHLGLAAKALGYQAITPAFLGVTEEEISRELQEAGFQADGKMKLYDGRDGKPFEQDIAVGYMYILKLHHMVEDKIHMRSIGPYSLITQQPLGGKAQGGGQRFGEMEVWALEGYGAAHTLREVLTVKSDDIMGRSAAFDAIIRGENLGEPNIPATFNVLLANLRGLALDVELERKADKAKGELK